MQLCSKSTTASVPFDLPNAQLITNNTSSTEFQVIREDIVTSLGEGSHHAPGVPVENTPLPELSILTAALSEIQQYFHSIGAAIVSDAHLQGLAAPVHTTGEGTIYAYLDRELFTTVLERVLSDIEPTQSLSGEAFEELIEAIVTAHTMEFAVGLQEEGVNPDTGANWPALKGKETKDPVGIVFTVPHPVITLNEYPIIPERALALVAGMQRLATEIDEVYTQRDVAFAYLPAYLRGHGLTAQQANARVSEWYEEPGECVSNVGKQIATFVATNGFPSEDPELAYYLTDPAKTELEGL